MKVVAENLTPETRGEVEKLGKILEHSISMWGSIEGTKHADFYGGNGVVGARRLPGKRGHSTVEIIREQADSKQNSLSVRFNLDRQGHLRSVQSSDAWRFHLREGHLFYDLWHAKETAEIRTAVDAEMSMGMVKYAGLMAVESSLAA